MNRPRIHVAVPASLPVTAGDPALTILRCAQEIVTNAARHAEAENLWLEISRNGEGIEIHARDDGRGATAIRSGNGLAGMRERIEQRGGTLSVETAPGRGFAVTAVLPLTGAAS